MQGYPRCCALGLQTSAYVLLLAPLVEAAHSVACISYGLWCGQGDVGR